MARNAATANPEWNVAKSGARRPAELADLVANPDLARFLTSRCRKRRGALRLTGSAPEPNRGSLNRPRGSAPANGFVQGDLSTTVPCRGTLAPANAII